MARIALIITLVLVLATCYFGYASRTKILGLNDKVAGLTSDLNRTTADLNKTKSDLKASEDELAKTKTDLEAAQAQVASLQSNLDSVNKQLTDANSKVDDLTKQIAALKNTNQGPAQNATLIYSKDDMDKVTNQLNDAKAQVAELTQVKETLTNKVKDAESRADDLQKVVDHYKNGTLRNGLEGEVLAYNPGWNFVVISLGDRQGAVANAEMILKRGGSQIGKIRITSVEPSTSVADIIPGSLARGVRVQPGDRVIFPGS